MEICMLYFRHDAATGALVEVITERDHLDRAIKTHGWGALSCRADFGSDRERAEQIAEQATELTGTLHVAIDNGPSVTPRHDVIVPPQVGDAVSYGFNGDSYPDGFVTHVTPGTLRIVKTDTGSTYYRRRGSGRWIKQGGTWGMTRGHARTLNRSF